MTDHNPFPPVVGRNGWEERLRECAKLGRVCSLGKRRPALDPGGEGCVGPVVRSEMIQRLAMGGDKDAPVHSRGVDLRNALIDGDLDFTHCSLKRNIRLINCVVTGYINLIGASGETIDLSGSRVLGSDPDGDAIAADRLKLSGSLFFRASGGEDAEPFEVDGAIRLYLADIRGNLNFAGGRFGVPSSVENGGDAAVIARGARIGGHVRISKETRFHGRLNLAAVRAGSFSIDAGAAKNNKGYLRTDGFVYDRIEGAPGLFEYAEAKAYLRSQPQRHLEKSFRTQPYEQLARVVEAMGNRPLSERIRFRKEQLFVRYRWRLFRRYGYAALKAPLKILGLWIDDDGRILNKRFFSNLVESVRNLLGFVLYWCFGILVGFGYRPMRAFYAVILFVFLGFLVFSQAYDEGSVVPNDPFVLRSDDWMFCLAHEARSGESASDCWRNMPQPVPPILRGVISKQTDEAPVRGRDYPEFEPLVFSIDTFVPFLDLKQEERWIPHARRGSLVSLPPLSPKPFGYWARFYLWLHIAIGWVIAALFVASFTRLIKSG